MAFRKQRSPSHLVAPSRTMSHQKNVKTVKEEVPPSASCDFHRKQSFPNSLLFGIRLGMSLRLVNAAFALVLLLSTLTAPAQSGIFNVKIGSPPAPPVPLVRHDNFWHYHKGTNA